MAVNVTLNGTVYAIPQTGNSGWGTVVTNYLVALSTGVLQKAGGTFTLTADVDFGATYGLKSAYFSTRTANPASAGTVRLANNEGINWRNAAASGNMTLKVNASNLLEYDGAPVLHHSNGSAYQVFRMNDGGTGYTYGAVNLAQSAAVTGTLALGNGGTGQTTANAALNALLPSQGSNSGKVLGTDASNTSWVTALLTTGGTFTLAAEVDFGATYGLKSAYFSTRSSNPASAGIVRLANNEGMLWRNAANSGDMTLKVNASNLLEYDGAPVLHHSNGSAYQVFRMNDGGTGYTYGAVNLAQSAAVTGTLAIGNGGTGQTTANAALNALLPSQGGNSGKVLRTDGTDTSWAAVAATVTTTRGDMIRRGASADERFAIGSANTVLKSDGTDPGWGLIVNANVDNSAAIAYSKLNLTGTLVNADVSGSAAIAYSKLNLSGGIVNADVNASAAIAYSKLNLTGGIVNADVNASAAIAGSKIIAATAGATGVVSGGTVPGTTSGSGTAAGYIGETQVHTPAAASFSSGVAANYASLTLNKGIYLVTAHVNITWSAISTLTLFSASISTGSASDDLGSLVRDLSTATSAGHYIGTTRVLQITSDGTVVYLVATATFTGGTAVETGSGTKLLAVRIG